jgi:hypothetical protein
VNDAISQNPPGASIFDWFVRSLAFSEGIYRAANRNTLVYAPAIHYADSNEDTGSKP